MSYAKNAMISVRMSRELKDVLETMARKDGVPLSRWIARAAREEARRRLNDQDAPLPNEAA
jgi:uncharacterized protein (DUF1778 family)